MNYTPFSKGFFSNTSVFGHLLKTYGEGVSDEFIGDIQVVSNIDGNARHFIYELYLKQQFGDFSILVGLHDLNSEFVVSDYAGDFINSSFGLLPTLSINVPISTFPVTSFGGVVFYNKKSFSVLSGIYNLNHDYLEEEQFDVNNHLYGKGFLGLVELRYRNNEKKVLNGEYKIGGYYKNCHHIEGEENDNCLINQNYGTYFVADQVLLDSPKNYQLGIFTQIGLAPLKKNYVSSYWGFGVSFRSVNKKLLPDFIGLAIGSVGINSFDLNNDFRETVLELSLKKEIIKRVNIQPDIQFIVSPSGIYSNAFVGGMRLQLDLN